MSILGRKVPGKAVAALAALIVIVTMLPVRTLSHTREIRVVAKNMAFYLEGDPTTPNPIIVLRSGESVRVVLQNEDRGMTHDFAVPALQTTMDLIGWGDHDEVAFTAPESPGTYEYVCRPHALMMKGTLLVTQ